MIDNLRLVKRGDEYVLQVYQRFEYVPHHSGWRDLPTVVEQEPEKKSVQKKYEGIIYCADGIIVRPKDSKIAIIKREHGSEAGKYCLPGGKQEPGESLHETLQREMQEEVGIIFVDEFLFGNYAERGRDVRGDFISAVFVCYSAGTSKNIPEQTPFWMDRKMIEELVLTDQFAWDHGTALTDYFKWCDLRIER